MSGQTIKLVKPLKIFNLNIMIRILLLTLMIIVSGCVTQRACENKFGECGRVETVTVKEYKDTTVYLDGETIYDTISFYRTDTIKLVDSTGRLTANIGSIKGTTTKWIQITSKPDTLLITKTFTTVKEGKTKYVDKAYVPLYYWLIVGGLSVLLLLSLIRR